MLEFVKIENPQSVYTILDQFNPKSSTWIVSDLKSKSEIQKKIMDQQGFFLESSILRISDFWKVWLRRLTPEVQVISTDFLKALIDLFIEKYGEDLQLKKSEASTLSSYLSELAPILLIPNSEKILEEWFEQPSNNHRKNKDKNWYRWFLLSKVCLKFLIVENKVIEARWIAAYLQSLDLSKLNWPFDIVVDLGTEMTSTEMSLFKIIGQKTNVKILVPDPAWKDQFPFLLKTYTDHEGYGTLTKLGSDFSLQPKNRFVRVSTQLAEVKECVSLARKWCDQGIDINQISIISPDIEHYWPCLQFYLKQEGLPVQKDQVANLASLEVFQILTSYLKNLKSEISWESLETSLFSNQTLSMNPSFSERQTLNYEKFKSLFYLIIDEDDLKRDEKIHRLFYRKINLQQNIDRDDFLSILSKLWIQIELSCYDKNGELFKTLFKDLIGQCSNITMKLHFWFKYLEQRIKNKEVKIIKGASNGIQVLPLMSAHLLEASHQIWIGLDERMLSNNRKMILPIQDALELKKNFDFALQLPEESFYDFNIRWQLSKPAVEKYYLCAHTSFDSNPLTSSLFFIENLKDDETKDPGPIRFDELQSNLYFKTFHEQEKLSEFSRVQDEVLNLHEPIRDIQFNELSATELEEYWLCPFKLLARKGFRLRELPFAGLDLDPRQKGSLSHQLFEFLKKVPGTFTQEKVPGTFFKEQVLAKLDEIRADLGVFQFEPEVWSLQRKRFLTIAENFINFENSRKSLLSLALEKDFKVYFDLKEKKFTTDEKEFAIKGRIDRIDSLQGMKNKLIVFDYKSSTGDLSNYKNFLKKGELQLLLYAVACEVVLYPESEVVAAVYFDSKLFKTNKGFMTSESAANVYQGRRTPAQVLLSEENKEVLYQEFFDVTFNLLNGIKNKNFLPKPYNTDICKTCDWNKICRAPHLMY